MTDHKNDIPKPEEISGILAAVSKELPGLVKGILDAFFSPEAAADMGKAVATFYTTLKEGGIPEEQALSMTRLSRNPNKMERIHERNEVWSP